MSEKNLNSEQLKAIKHKSGPQLIIAGAGTGKTTVITERIKYLIEKKIAKSSEILALTFTEKAAREMEERVDIALPYGYTQMWISTFHSFGDRILRREALQIGLDPKYKLLSSAETIQFIRNNLFEFELNYFRPLGNPTKFVGGLCQHFSRLQDENINPSEYLTWVNDKLQISNDKDRYKELANAYKKYEELKIRDGVMDYGDLIFQTVNLFKKRPNVLTEYKKQFKYILVDEFQDTNISQYELIKFLADPKENPNLTVVGDDSQSIYKFRGAAISNILNFKKDFPKIATFVLTKNYRSTQKILDASYQLIKNNDPDTLEAQLGIQKKLESMTDKKGEDIKFIHCDRVENEAEEVAETINQLTNKPINQYQYKDIAILVRANNHAEPLMRALARRGIPYQFLGPGRLFKQSEVIDLISYLRVLYNFEDSISFYRLLSADFFNIDARDLAVLGNFARKNNFSFLEAIEKFEEINLKQETKEVLEKLVKLIHKHFNQMKRESAGQILYYFMEEFNLLELLLNPKDLEAQKKSANISKLFDKLKTYEVDHTDASVFAVVDWIDLSTEIGESPLSVDSDWNAVNAVNILTVHGSKGLEFPVVFMVNLVSLRFPSTERREQIPIPDAIIKEVLPTGDPHIQEERRLFYVGMTRAKKLLYFTAADYYGEGKRDKKLSPFIFESLGSDIEKSKLQNLNIKQFQNFNFQNTKNTTKSQIKNKLKINFLSYSQIETFLTCPLHYKLKYIAQIPTPPSAAMSMGTSVHETLKDLYLEPNKNFEELLEKNWINLGFKSKKHATQMKEKAKIFLRNFVEKEFDKTKKPLALEQSFKIGLASDLKIGGKIDRIDDLGNGKIEIIDYKTGSTVPTQKEVDKNLQLTLYAMASGKSPKDITLSLYYFETGEKIQTTRTKEQLEEAKKEILKIRDEIEKSDFACSGNYFCQNCEFKIFCKSEIT